ncbi:unnamed protein product [Scytosiphon promiscuus]
MSHFGGNWKLDRRRRCCFCCSLRAGVAILATLDLFYKGIFGTFFALKDAEESFNHLLDQAKSEYARLCSGTRAQSDQCVQMDHAIQQLTSLLDSIANQPPIFYVQGVITIMAGLAGLYAVCRSSALAAKVYLWTWLPRFFAMMVMQYITYTRQKELGIDQHKKTAVITQAINLVVFAYFIKVSWSYHQRLKHRFGDVSSAPVAEGRIQLPGRHGSVV